MSCLVELKDCLTYELQVNLFPGKSDAASKEAKSMSDLS